MLSERSKTLLLLAAVLLVGGGLRLAMLESRVLWFDEAVSLSVAQSGPAGAVVAAKDDTHPPLYHLALHYWLRLAPGESGARLFSAAAGLLTVLVVFAIGYRLGGRPAAVTAGLLLAICPLHVWYSQELRMYALQTLLIALSWWLLLRALEQRDTASWLFYALTTTAALYTQYTTLYSIAAQNLYVIATQSRTKLPWRMWWRSQAALAILFLPWVPVFWHHLQAKTFGYWMRPLDWADPLRFLALLSGAIPKNPGPYWPWIAVSIVVIASALVVRRVWFVILWLLVPVTGLALQSLGANVFVPRALLFVAPALALMVGCSLAAQPRRRLLLATVTLLVAANLNGLAQYYFLPNAWIRSALRTAAGQVAGGFRSGDLVVHASRFSYRPFQHYLDAQVPQVLEEETEPMPHLFRVIGTRGLPRNQTHYNRVWVIWQADFQRPTAGDQIREWLREAYDEGQEVFRTPELQVTLHQRQMAESLLAPTTNPRVTPNGGPS